MTQDIISKEEYKKAKSIVEAYEKTKSIKTKELSPSIADDLIQLYTSKKLGDTFNMGFAYHKMYRNDFEGYVDNPGIIEGIDIKGNLMLKFYTGGELFPNNTRLEYIHYKYINQTTEDYSKKYQLCSDKLFILKIIAEQMFQHFISWYGPRYTEDCTNMYRMVEDVIDDWNCFIIKSKVKKIHTKFIVNIFKDFSPIFYEEMSERMKNRIGTDRLDYKKFK